MLTKWLIEIENPYHNKFHDHTGYAILEIKAFNWYGVGTRNPKNRSCIAVIVETEASTKTEVKRLVNEFQLYFIGNYPEYGVPRLVDIYLRSNTDKNE